MTRSPAPISDGSWDPDPRHSSSERCWEDEGWLWVPFDLLLSPCCGHGWVGSPHPTAHVGSGVVLGSLLLESTRKIRIHLRAPEQKWTEVKCSGSIGFPIFY